MKLAKLVRSAAVVLACWNFVVPLRLIQAAVSPSSSDTLSVQKDLAHIALGANGRLSGQLVDPQGKPLHAHPVSVYQAQNPQPNAEPIADVKTDAKGRFVIEGLKSGAYIVVADESVTVCRCWNANVAPPVAKPQVLMVTDGQIQRGQHPIGEMLFANPIILILLIVAAIAIPVAIHNSQDNAS